MTLRNQFESLARDFDKVFIGFDDYYNYMTKLHDDIAKNVPNYPPFNIKKVEDNKYVIEIAVAGFNKSQIDIELAEDKLIVKGNASESDDDTFGWIYRGIANRNFTRTFALTDNIEIEGADLVNGMLKIFLERIIPEHKKPRKIPLSTTPPVEQTKQLLTEKL